MGIEGVLNNHAGVGENNIGAPPSDNGAGQERSARLYPETGEIRNYLVTSWAEIKAHLPEDFPPQYKNFAREYFRVQLRIARGRMKRAAELFKGLGKRTGFEKFEDENPRLLAAIDLAVKGNTRIDTEFYPPLFIIDK